MRKLIIFAFCLVEVLQTAPVSGKETFVIPKEVYDSAFLRYEGEHDIVDIVVPSNAINFAASEGDSEADSETVKDVTVFFAEADIKDGNRKDRGLYRFKNNDTKMILPTGRTAASSSNNNKLVFFGASDGLYVYNVDSDSADKYGPITDGITSMVSDETGKTIHILTDDHKVYKVTNNGETKEAVNDIVDAQEMVVDDEDVIYYRNSKNEVFIKSHGGVIKAQNLPENPKSVRLIRPPFFMSDSIPMLYDGGVYMVYVNGTTEHYDVNFSPESVPTAVSLQAVYVTYYGYNRKLYEFNMLGIRNNHNFDKIRHITERIDKATNTKRRLLGRRKLK